MIPELLRIDTVRESHVPCVTSDVHAKLQHWGLIVYDVSRLKSRTLKRPLRPRSCVDLARFVECVSMIVWLYIREKTQSWSLPWKEEEIRPYVPWIYSVSSSNTKGTNWAYSTVLFPQWKVCTCLAGYPTRKPIYVQESSKTLYANNCLLNCCFGYWSWGFVSSCAIGERRFIVDKIACIVFLTRTVSVAHFIIVYCAFIC